MATFQDFIDQVRRELEEGTETVWSDDSLLAWTNEASRDFAYKTRCLADEQYTTTVVGQQSYELPSYTIEPVMAVYETEQLARATPSAFFATAAETTTTGTPTTYTVYGDLHGGAIYLHPTPSAAGTLRYWRTYYPTPFDSTDDTGVMPFGSLHDEALRNYVKARAYEQTGELDRAQYHTQAYEREVAETDYERVREGSTDLLGEPATSW